MATPKANPKQTSPSVASKAGKLLSNPKTPPAVKSVAGSDLGQARLHAPPQKNANKPR